MIVDTPRRLIRASAVGRCDQVASTSCIPGYERVGSLPGRDRRVHVLLKDHLLERKIKFLLLQPTEMGLRPPGLPAIDPAMTQQEGPQTLPGLQLHRLHVFPCAGQVAHRLLVRSRYPYPGELTGAVQARKCHRVAAIRLDPIPGLARDQARRHDLAVVAGLANLSVNAVAARARFIDEAQYLSRRSLKVVDEFLQ